MSFLLPPGTYMPWPPVHTCLGFRCAEGSAFPLLVNFHRTYLANSRSGAFNDRRQFHRGSKPRSFASRGDDSRLPPRLPHVLKAVLYRRRMLCFSAATREISSGRQPSGALRARQSQARCLHTIRKRPGYPMSIYTPVTFRRRINSYLVWDQ